MDDAIEIPVPSDRPYERAPSAPTRNGTAPTARELMELEVAVAFAIAHGAPLHRAQSLLGRIDAQMSAPSQVSLGDRRSLEEGRAAAKRSWSSYLDAVVSDLRARTVELAALRSTLREEHPAIGAIDALERTVELYEGRSAAFQVALDGIWSPDAELAESEVTTSAEHGTLDLDRANGLTLAGHSGA